MATATAAGTGTFPAITRATPASRNVGVFPRWLDEGVPELSAASREELAETRVALRAAWRELVGGDGDNDHDHDDEATTSATTTAEAAAVASTATELAKARLRVGDTRDVRMLLGMAAKANHGAALFTSGSLMLAGRWPRPLTPRTQPIDPDAFGVPEKAKAKEVVRAIRALQRANKRKDEQVPETPPLDREWGLELIRRAARVGNVDAMLWLGRNEDLPLDERVAALENAAKTDLDALYELGSLLYEEDASSPRSLARARACFDTALAQAHPAAQFFVGHCHRVGDSLLQIPPNETRAEELLRLAAENGHGAASTYLARWAMERNEPASVVVGHLARGAKDGDAEAIHMLADAHLSGEFGLPVDHTRAFNMYMLAGANGEAAGYLSAGAMVLDTKQFRLDDNAVGLHGRTPARAAELYQLAADAGSVEAWSRLADLYESGVGVAKDVDAALRIRKFLREIGEDSDDVHVHHPGGSESSPSRSSGA